MTVELFNQIALIILGLGLLLVAGDILVRGAVSLAAALRIPALLVSLTIVAFGTSAPELFVTVQAVMDNADGIALGNIIGSNIANIFLVLGLPALVYPVSTHVPGLRRHIVFMLLSTAAFLAIAYGPRMIDTTIGGGLVAGILAYVGYMGVRASHGAKDNPVLDEVEEYASGSRVSAKTLLFLAFGLIGLPAGASLLVENSAALALDLGIREEVIGLTIVAFGTSLPELATVLAAAFHKKSDVAIGGVVGSNIFNILAVGGAAGLSGTAFFDPASLRLDIPVMAIAAVTLAAFVLTRRDIGRISGILFVAAYVGFILVLARNAGAF